MDRVVCGEMKCEKERILFQKRHPPVDFMEWNRKKEQLDLSIFLEQSMLKEENVQTVEGYVRNCSHYSPFSLTALLVLLNSTSSAVNENGNCTKKRGLIIKDVCCNTREEATFYQGRPESEEETEKNHPEKKESIEIREIMRSKLNTCVRKRFPCDDRLVRGQVALKLRSRNLDNFDKKNTVLNDVQAKEVPRGLDRKERVCTSK